MRVQNKLNGRHAKWLLFIETFPYVIKYKQGKENIVADFFSRRYVLLNTLNAKLLGFEHIKDLYEHDIFLAPFVESCEKGLVVDNYLLLDGFLFRKGKFCISSCSIRELLVREAHGGGLMPHHGVCKTYNMLSKPL